MTLHLQIDASLSLSLIFCELAIADHVLLFLLYMDCIKWMCVVNHELRFTLS